MGHSAAGTMGENAAPLSAEVEELLESIRRINRDNLALIAETMPDVAETRKRQYAAQSVRPLLFRLTMRALPVLFPKPPRYLFQGLRHLHLMETLPPDEVMVLGGRDEFSYCRKKGYRFLWIGFLDKAFGVFVGSGEKEPLARSLQYLRKYLPAPPGMEKRLLFLWEDTLPVGLSLAVALSGVKGVEIACIAHGFFPRHQGKATIREGSRCRFNLLWDDSQRQLFREDAERRLLVLGLPYQVCRPRNLSNRVILVGHCDKVSEPMGYFLSLYHFNLLYPLLEREGFEVAFRPHPQDDREFVRGFFPRLATEEKLELFASGRMVFIGFSSSLLYEAKEFGNIVIGLDTSKWSYHRSFEVDAVFHEQAYGELPSYLRRVLAERASVPEQAAPLAERFSACIETMRGEA